MKKAKVVSWCPIIALNSCSSVVICVSPVGSQFDCTVLMGYPDLCHVNRSQTCFSQLCLAGLAKPMGLVEGPGGLGQGGAAATLGEDSREAEGRYEEYGYNAQLSDRISLDRNIPDYRPKK